tara:strand:- start:79 stop:336 length:258 start_codon:yes stop_codon:yes gene_type:complete
MPEVALPLATIKLTPAGLDLASILGGEGGEDVIAATARLNSKRKRRGAVISRNKKREGKNKKWKSGEVAIKVPKLPQRPKLSSSD